MYTPSQEIGVPIPNNTEHAVSVTLPTWEAIVGYEEGDQKVVGKMQTGYPRFFIHKSVGKLNEYLLKKYGRPGSEDVFVYPSYKIARKCREYMEIRVQKMENAPAKGIRIVKLYTPAPCLENEKTYRSQFDIGVVFFPSEYFKYGKEFWQHSGEITSSRLAEYLLHEFEFQELLKQNAVLGTDDRIAEDDKQFVEEKFGRNLNFLEFTNANRIIRKRIMDSVAENNPGVDVGTEDDVYLYPTGMSSIYNSHRMIMDTREPAKTVVFGFPYVDTMNIALKFGPGMIHLGHGSSEELDELEKSMALGTKVLAVIAECPLNPLLRTPDLKKLKRISEKYDFPVVIDETVGNCVNINVHPYADIVCASLTKIFSGDSNVMAGSLVLNKGSKYYAGFKSWMNRNYENNLWKEDCIYLERNSRDFLRRNDKTNHNAEKVVELFEKYKRSGDILEIFHPLTSESRPLYDEMRNEKGGYGGLLSVLLKDGESSKKFYNELALSKGPSLGTNFTLVCPYAVLVHYNELDHVAQYGVHENLIRISIGIEPTDELLKVMEDALKKAVQ